MLGDALEKRPAHRLGQPLGPRAYGTLGVERGGAGLGALAQREQRARAGEPRGRHALFGDPARALERLERFVARAQRLFGAASRQQRRSELGQRGEPNRVARRQLEGASGFDQRGLQLVLFP